MSSRKEQKEALRRERLEREQTAAAAQRRRRLVGYGVGGALALAAVVAVVVALTAGGGGNGDGGDFGKGTVPDQQITDLAPAAKAAGCTSKDFKEEGRTHVGGTVQYRSRPPHSGNHNPDAFAQESRAYYDEAPALEYLVHALEHGRIIIWFRPSAPEKVKADLKALYDEDPPGVILAPDQTEMPYEVAASAWGRNKQGHVLGCKRMNAKVFDAIRAFKDAYRGNGPEPIAF